MCLMSVPVKMKAFKTSTYHQPRKTNPQPRTILHKRQCLGFKNLSNTLRNPSTTILRRRRSLVKMKSKKEEFSCTKIVSSCWNTEHCYQDFENGFAMEFELEPVRSLAFFQIRALSQSHNKIQYIPPSYIPHTSHNQKSPRNSKVCVFNENPSPNHNPLNFQH